MPAPHSSRRRRFASAVVGAVVVAAGLSAAAPEPAGAAFAEPLTAVSRANLGLTWHAESPKALDALDTALPNVGVATVLDESDRTMADCGAEENAAKPLAPVATWAMCFDTEDATTPSWSPQGVTSSGDADDDGAWGARKALLTGWNHDESSGRYNDARVGFIDMNGKGAPRYRWVYLVDPNADGTDFTAAKTHIGGMVWYGDKLIVNAVGNGSVALRVFSMDHILRTTSEAGAMGRVADGWAAHAYGFVMPQIGYYTYTSGFCSMGGDQGVPCFSTLSLDRSTSPDSLVTAEYFTDPALRGRLIRYPMGPDYRPPDSAAASEAYASAVGNQQGVLSYAGRWYVAHSSEIYSGQLWRFTPKSSSTGGAVRSCSVGGASSNMCWSLHSEALTHWVSTGMVYSLTEWPRDYAGDPGPGGRVLFGLPLSGLP
ncbi:hypothetical protein AB0I28_14660 [Phytomonospora sp. NPDC050363]|uniref:hypothetical protein n=1 Tax=Phytomonospora sp. NPDC050363 TaxID=3155642 RepID=UPI0033FCAEFE